MLLFEELALVAINPASGRHALGVGERLNACLAGLLVAESLEGAARPESDRDDRIELVDGPEPASASLAAAAGVVAEKGPKIKAVLSGMDRGLHRQLGAGTWPSAVSGLVRPACWLRRPEDCAPTTTSPIPPPRTRSSSASGPPPCPPTDRRRPGPDRSQGHHQDRQAPDHGGRVGGRGGGVHRHHQHQLSRIRSPRAKPAPLPT